MIWTISNVDAGEDICEISYQAQVDLFEASGDYTNVAIIDSDHAEIVDHEVDADGNDTIDIKASATVSILP